MENGTASAFNTYFRTPDGTKYVRFLVDGKSCGSGGGWGSAGTSGWYEPSKNAMRIATYFANKTGDIYSVLLVNSDKEYAVEFLDGKDGNLLAYTSFKFDFSGVTIAD